MIRDGILASAKSLGVNPIDLATAISYETAGTFDPTKAGPTTQWGQHKGLIQFGEPQAKQYGVDWNDPVGSQLGENGAVVKYLRNTGVKPGMGLLDIYSAINAGGVGRYNRTDANNGGAPGTVRDKVMNQMAGHRAKAEALIGGAGDTTMAGQQGTDTMQAPQQQRGLLFNALPEKAQNFMTPDRVARLQMALEGMTLNPNQGVIQAASQTLKDNSERKQANKTAEWLAKNGRPDLAEGVMSGAIDGRSAIAAATSRADPVKGVNIDGKLVNPITGEMIADYSQQEATSQKRIVTGKTAEALGLDPTKSYNITEGPEGLEAKVIGGGGITVNTGSEVGAIPQGFELFTDEETGARRLRPIEGSEAATKAAAAEKQKETAAASADIGLKLIDDIMNSPDLAGVTGMIEGRIPPRTPGQQDLLVKIEQLQGKAFLSAFETLKGGGQITEREGQAAQNAMARLQRAQSDEAYRAALQELRSIMALGASRAPNSAATATDDPLGIFE